jgi:hypothetical protein
MGVFYNWFYSQTYWLYSKIFENGLFFLDYWSLVHLWGGVVIFMVISALKIKGRGLWLLGTLLLFDLPETVYLHFSTVLESEILKDQVTDIIMGLSGGLISYKIVTLRPGMICSESVSREFQMLFSSFTLAFIWVGSYHYHYNVAFLNTSGLNLWAFILWGLGGYYIIKVYLIIKRRIESRVIQLIFLWMMYFSSLLIIEFAGYYCMNIAEISFSNGNPLIFGLIHGSFWLHLYYLTVPFLIVSFYEIFAVISVLARHRDGARQPAQVY